MPGPWEQYQSAVPTAQPSADQSTGPWTAYQSAPSQADALKPPSTVTASAKTEQKEPGLLDKISNFFTGADRQTRATNDLPELQSSGLLSGLDISPEKAAQISATLTTTLDPAEAANILRSASPDIGIQQDEKGNWLAANNKTGARAVINKPGVSGMDALQAGALTALYTPAGRAAAGVSGGLKAAGALGAASALTETGIQGAQAAAGGNFDAGDVALAGAAGVGGELLARGAGAVGDAARSSISNRQAQASQLRNDFDAAVATGESPDDAAQRLLAQFPDAQPMPAVTPETAANAVVDASQAGKRQQMPTIDRLATEASPDQRVLDAAKRLGIDDQLIPSQYSTSQPYREIEQGLASIPGSQLNAQQKQAYASLAQKADDLITQYGGTVDKAALSDSYRTQGLSAIDDLEKQSNALYDQVSAAIPPTTQASPVNTLQYLNQKVVDLGDRTLLSAAERRTLGALSRTDGQGKPVLPTYAALDQIRKEVGAGLRGAGRFKDTESGALKRLYAALSDDQQGVADAAGVGDMFGSAKALVGQRKQLEENLQDVLGKDLTGALTSTFGNAVKQLGSGNFKRFDEVLQRIPENLRQQAVMTSLNDAFTAGSRAEKQLSAPGFVDWYSSLDRNQAAKDRLLKYLPGDAAKRLDDIYMVAKGMRDASKERITTGRIGALLDNFANDNGMLGKLWDVGKKAAAAEGVTSSMGIPGTGTVGVLVSTLNKQKTPIADAAGNLLASPRFRDALNAYARSGGNANAAVTAQEKRLTRTAVYRKWAAALGDTAKARVATVGPLAYLAGSADD
ncbi:hypothetical protein [Pseudomonas typographi]|uniref:hypothetical protein n=1 Tax=Pseudomonas typographi TaxID=2715964 RepID=UPI00168844E1|nr:hypothetical protein [Pseudomonas typographi]